MLRTNLQNSIQLDFFFNPHQRICLLILERKAGGKRNQWESNIDQLPPEPAKLGIEQATFWCMGRCSSQLSHPARAAIGFFNSNLSFMIDTISGLILAIYFVLCLSFLSSLLYCTLFLYQYNIPFFPPLISLAKSCSLDGLGSWPRLVLGLTPSGVASRVGPKPRQLEPKGYKFWAFFGGGGFCEKGIFLFLFELEAVT